MTPKKNYIDSKGNYINSQNLSLADIYNSGLEEGYRIAKDESEYLKKRFDLEGQILNEEIIKAVNPGNYSKVSEIIIDPVKGDAVKFIRESTGYWEPMDKDDHPLPHPMLVCSECQKTNHYPGKYCTYCGSYNGGDE